MRLPRIAILFNLVLLLTFGIIQAQIKEVQSQVLARLDKTESGEFQLLLRFTLPSLPEEAIFNDAVLVLDQSFDAVGGRETPKGLANKTGKPVKLCAYGLAGRSVESNDQWIDPGMRQGKRSVSAELSTANTVKTERTTVPWGKYAVEFPVTRFIQEQLKQQNSDVVFVVAKATGENQVLKTSDVNCDVSNLTGKLYILYMAPPKLPPWIKTK